MQDNALENAFVTVLDAVAGLESVNCYSSHYAGARTTPSITVESKSQSLDGSVAVFRAELEFVVESDANDTLAATHAGYIEAIRAVLANKATLTAAINSDQIKLYGFAFYNTTTGTEATRYRTTLNVRAGYGVPQ